MNIVEYIKKHIQFLIMVVVWCISGIYADPSFYLVIPLSILLLKRKKMYVELICGFFVIIVLSDSWETNMHWAGRVKDIYLVMLSLFAFFNPKEFRYKNALIYPFIPFFALAVILIARNPDMMLCAQKTLSYILIFTVLPVYFIKLLTEEKERFLKGLTYTAACLLLYGFILILISYDVAFLGDRYRGVMGNPNGIGIFCTILTAFFTIITSKYKNLFSRKEIIFIYALIFISVILSGSRNTVISILIFFGFSTFFRVSYWLGFTIIIVIAIVYQVILANLTDIISAFGLQSYMRVEHLEDGSGRIVAWLFGWSKIQENFFIGRGFNYEGWLYQQYAPQLYVLGHIGNSHNSYLATWLNTGLVGLILFLYALIYRFVKASVNSPYALPLMYCVFFSANFEAWLVGSLNPHTPLLILIWTLMTYDVKQEQPVEKLKIEKYKIPSLAT